MAAQFRRNNSGEWVVVGTEDEVFVGKVKVARKDGSIRYVSVVRVGEPFSDKYAGGDMRVYGYIGEGEEDRPSPVPAAPPSEDAKPCPYGCSALVNPGDKCRGCNKLVVWKDGEPSKKPRARRAPKKNAPEPAPAVAEEPVPDSGDNSGEYF